MPGLNRTTESISSSDDERSGDFEKTSSHGSAPSSVEDSPFTYEYPAVNFPGYAEKPLDEQLEPLAVVGMGVYNMTRDQRCRLLNFCDHRLQTSRRSQGAQSALGHDDQPALWPDSQSACITIQH